jgi:hypothetical protein
VSETERLRRANSSLMEALREERSLRTRLEKELAAVKVSVNCFLPLILLLINYNYRMICWRCALSARWIWIPPR